MDRELLEYFLDFDPDDIPTYNEVLEDYWDECPESVYEETKDFYFKQIDEVDFYSDGRELYLELNNNPTLVDIDLPDEVLNQVDDDIFEAEYTQQVNDACEAFKDVTGEKLYLLGRNGRHACVELNVDNFINYENLKSTQKWFEQHLINYFNFHWLQDDAEVFE